MQNLKSEEASEFLIQFMVLGKRPKKSWLKAIFSQF